MKNIIKQTALASVAVLTILSVTMSNGFADQHGPKPQPEATGICILSDGQIHGGGASGDKPLTMRQCAAAADDAGLTVSGWYKVSH
jgi:hypothetical protein